VNLASAATTVSSVVTGKAHACALLSTGSVIGGVKCWGANGSGQLGIGPTGNKGGSASDMGDALPFVNLGTSALALTAGQEHTCALLSTGKIKCWGLNSSGQLGLGDTTLRNTPASTAIDLGTALSPVAIAAGTLHTCALFGDGTEKCWGGNTSGQLGLGDANSRGDSSNEMSNNLPRIKLGIDRPAIDVVTGGYATCAILENGPVKCWGFNDYGTLGQGDTVRRGVAPAQLGDALPAIPLGSGRSARRLALGDAFVCVLLDTGAIKCWGDNYYGQLGIGDKLDRGDGPNEMNDNLAAVPLGTGRTGVAISAGDNQACALLDNGTVKCWGANTWGALGQGDTTDAVTLPASLGMRSNRYSSVAVARRAALQRTDSRRACCWTMDQSNALAITTRVSSASAMRRTVATSRTNWVTHCRMLISGRCGTQPQWAPLVHCSTRAT
jgi:alpha-tubulin suppressor-like RCC1 family protein